MPSNPSSILTINLANIRENYRRLKEKAAGIQCGAVVKANGYGLGALEVTGSLLREGCRHFFTATLDEALELREAYTPEILPDIYVFNGLDTACCDEFLAHRITPILCSHEQVIVWSSKASALHKKLPAVIHVDTGMNRLGFSPAEFEKLDSSSLTSLDIKFIMSHLACADVENHPMNAQQLDCFQKVINRFKGQAIKFSLANSGGIFLGAYYHFDLLRPGIALYGVNPQESSVNPMLDVVDLKSRIIQMHCADADGTVGYRAAGKVKKGAKLATVSIGYADGVPWSLSNVAFNGYIGNYPVPLMGRVTMDLMVFDVSDVPEDVLNSGWVEIFGQNNKINEIAMRLGVVAYDILTKLGRRPLRVYKEEDV